MSDGNGNGLVTLACDFDYDVFGADAPWLRQKTNACRRLGRQTVESIVQLGEELLEVKERLKARSKGYYEYVDWAKRELGLGEGFLTRATQAAVFCRSHPLTDLRVAPSALYLLTSSTTPESVRQQVLEEARESGNLVTHKQVASKVKEAKKAAESATANLAADDEDASEPQAAPDLPPWHEFETQIRQAIGTLRQAYKQIADATGYEPSTKQMRGRWARNYSPAGTLGAISALAAALEKGLPVELDPSAPGGYVTAQSVMISERAAS